MRIVFVGAVAFSRRCLEETLAAGGDVVGVLTLAPRSARWHSDYEDLGPVAAAHGVPLFQVDDINDSQTIALVRSLRPDVIFVLGWSQLIGAELLSVSPAIGSHPALLPRDRGRHPITWALVDGLDRSGLTFFWLDDGADSGDILWQRSFPIGPDENASTVYRRIEDLAAMAIREFLPQLAACTAPRIPQDETKATYRRKRTDEDRWIEWGASTLDIHNLVRGLARPYVGALTRAGDQDVLVWRTRVSETTPESTAAAAGTVLAAGTEVLVRTGDGSIAVIEAEPADAFRVGLMLESPR